MPSKDKKAGSRAGNRRDRNQRFRSREPFLGYYLIVTDTEETEKNYFTGLRDSIPEAVRGRIAVHVVKAKTTYNLVETTRDLCGVEAQERIPWIVLDRDQVKDFDELIESAERSDIHVGWSNPCFEIWMYAYFGEMPSIQDSWTCCDRFEDKFEKVMGQKYQKNDVAIYRKLNEKGDFVKAYQIAERKLKQAQADEKKPSESAPACTVHHLVKEIWDKVKGQE